MSIEFLLQNANPSDYSVPVLTIASGGSTPLGIEIYPTKIIVWGSAERAEDFQTVNISENRITHICVTFVKGYEGVSGKNLCSVYINGISNICFSFDGSSSFGNGNMVIGQPDTDFYLYKMRVYGSALEAQAVFNNFLNCVFDGVEFTRTQLNAENNVLDGDIVDYTKVKAAGYNIMVVTTPNNVAIPSFFNNVTVKGCAVRFEYAGEEEKNVTVDGVDMDGQGTTSKKYFRWNLRWKTSDETVWTYGDGTSETGKEGHFIKDESHARVDRITAKKNIASSPQGHKMGLTGLYNDLFHAINAVADGLPDQTFRVAVFQFPFVGFKYNTENGQYDFIGIYTVGPDKGSKVTFGYKKKVYPNCLSIEGPNHAPRGTRFLTPWADVEYSPADETLNMNEDEAWDCDYVKYETTYGKNGESYPDDWAAIRALYESEWRPAYECVYNNSPYIASYQEVIAGLNDPSIDTLEKLLTIANASAVKGAKAVGMTLANEYITFYDSSYELYFYRRAAGRFVSVAAYNTETGDNLVHNALTGLSAYLTEAADPTHPTTAEIIAARGARFHATAGDYFDIDQTLFHYCFCIIWAVTDNFAKNSYPQKFLLLSESGAGNRWGWRQDDLDSVLMTDNNGTNTKKYSVEHLDTFDNTQIFQGGDSALWVLIKEWFQTETRDMMSLIASAASTLANRLGIQGSGEHESLFNLTSYYCWDHSAKYFPATLYEKERRWSYIEPWLLAGTVQPGSSDLYPSAYNGVAPLTQAVGDQYQGERLWMERRIAYIFSKYRLGAFSGTATGYNAIVFTLARTFTFTLTPAIDLYPVVSLVESDSQAGRTPAGTPAQVSIATTGDSNNSIHGGDWLADLGDLSQMRLGSRGGATSIDFFIVAARLQTLKIGDADASRLVDGFNATGFGVTSPTLTYLDARNTGTVRNNINLLGCPRLRTCLFEGSGAAGLLLPVGAKLTVVSFPSAANTVFMHSLQFLRYEDTILPALAGITTLYINNCANLNPLEIVEDIIETVGEQLAYATLIWGGLVQGSVNTLIALSERSGWVEFDGESVLRRGGKPHVEGMVQISGMFVDDLDGLDIVSEETYQGNLKKALSDLFGTKLYVIYDPDSLWIRFADENVKSVCVTNWDTNGDGELSTLEASVVTYSQMSGKLNLNTIVSFDEFVYFTGVTRTGNSYVNFGSAVNLEYITIPSSVTNVGDRTFNAQNGTEKSLKRITFNNTRGAISFGSYVVYDTTAFPNLAAIVIKSLDNWLNNSYSDNNYSNPLQRAHHLYVGEDEVTSITFPSTKTSVQGYCLYGMSYLTSINLHSAITSIGAYAFSGCSRWVDNLVIPNSVTSISQYAFNGCTGLLSLTTPSSISTLNIAALVGGAARYGRVIVQGNLTHNSATGTMSTNHVVIKGNFSNPYATQAFSTYCKSVRVAGDWANSSGFVIYAGSGATSQFEFLEVLGVISGSGRIFYNQANTSQVSGCIVHLGYNGIGSTPALIFKNSNGNLVTTRISKVYVGSGESEAADQAVLDQYLADSDWAAYSSKLDLWWNYKNSPNANPYYITPINQL